jgi:ATP-dependent RNA helicase RhlE
LIDPVQQALVEEKYEVPTPIQAQTIPPALEGRDILGCAQTGTGKTAAFALPILNRLGSAPRKSMQKRPFVLVLAPTRELAIQIDQSFATYGRNLRLRRALVYGGVGMGNQVRAMDRGAHIVVATPGRLLDLMNQGYIKLDRLEVFVLDEADRMLDMGFLPDLKRIISQLPPDRQSLFFSATLPPKIVELSQSLLQDPVHVTVTPESTCVERIEQHVLLLDRGEKRAKLREIVEHADAVRTVVFTRTKRGADIVEENLLRTGIKAVAIHGNKSQNARQRALIAFRSNLVHVLVATDVAARGIDIDGVTHVINYDMPIEPESYVHRIGRTGRAGASGIAISFCTPDERGELRAIERVIGRRLTNEPEREERQERQAGPRDGESREGSGRRRRPPRRRAGSRPGGSPRASAKSAAAHGDRPPRQQGEQRSSQGRAESGTGKPKRRRKWSGSRARAKQPN